MIKERRRALRAGLVAATAVALAAAVVTAPGSAQAATLFTDTFEDGDSGGWTTSGGTWSVTTDGSQVLRQAGTSSDARARTGQASWTSYTVTARVKPTAFNGANRFVALIGRAQSNTSYYYLALRSNNTVELKKLVAGSSTTLATAPVTVGLNQWYTLSLRFAHTTIVGTVNHSVSVSASDTQFSGGQIGVATYNASANFDDVTVIDEQIVTEPPVTTAPTTPTAGPTRTTPPTTRATTPPTATPPTATTGPTSPPPTIQFPNQADGWASVPGLGQNGTSGGAGGATVTATNAAQFIDYISRPEPLIVQVQGTITLPTGSTDGMYQVSSNKTLIGLGSTARIENGGLNIGLPVDDDVTSPPANAVKNVIIRNLSFSGATDDAINVQMFTHHVWIDHNDLSNGDDGLIDIKRGSDYVTVSWNRTHDHDKTMLLGHDDANGAQDIGRLRVTYHHNFMDGSDQRNPRVRFGDPVHVYNNYCRNASYCIVSAMNAGLLVENNYFQSVNNPGRVVFSGTEGRIVERGNILVDTNHPIETRGPVQELSQYYSYRLDPAAQIPTIVPAGAGVGKI